MFLKMATFHRCLSFIVLVGVLFSHTGKRFDLLSLSYTRFQFRRSLLIKNTPNYYFILTLSRTVNSASVDGGLRSSRTPITGRDVSGTDVVQGNLPLEISQILQ